MFEHGIYGVHNNVYLERTVDEKPQQFRNSQDGKDFESQVEFRLDGVAQWESLKVNE